MCDSVFMYFLVSKKEFGRYHCMLVGRAFFFPAAMSCSSVACAAIMAVRKLSCNIPLDDNIPKP